MIRHAVPDDLDGFLSLERAVAAEAGESSYPKDTIEALLKYTDVLLERDGGDIVGYCVHAKLTPSSKKALSRILHLDRGKRCKNTCLIANLAVRRDCRGKGYGTKLVEGALKKRPVFFVVVIRVFFKV